ncbi:RHS repeat-associated core domain-containing protein, partial [Pseudomonas viridiflava]
SGKERDASGLYYYGLRYYAPWLQRWINPDPAGDVDGLNIYRMLRNNPTVEIDINGLIGERRGAKGATEASKLHYDHYLVPKIMERKEQDKEHAIASVMKRAGLERANAAGELLD